MSKVILKVEIEEDDYNKIKDCPDDWASSAYKAIKYAKRIEECDDCVSRQAIIAEMRNLYPDIPFVDFNNARLKWTLKYKPYLDCEKVVKGMSPVTPKREENMVSEEVYTEEYTRRKALEYEKYVLEQNMQALK